MDKVQNIIKTILSKMNLLSYDEKLSLTNLIVYIFTAITAFRLLFANVTIHFSHGSWNIPDLNISVVLPMLFGLLNYGHKRYINDNNSD
jgi:hypothetical protein